MRFASPPVGGIVYRSPSSSNTIVCPSGDTSSEIQVPSDVVKSTLRVVFRGSESGRWAARDWDERTGKTARTAATSSLEITGTPGEKSVKAEGVPEQRQGNPLTYRLQAVDKPGTPCDHSPRANTNQRLSPGPGLTPRSFTVSAALTRRPGWK